MEGQFLNMANGQESKAFVRKNKYESQEEFAKGIASVNDKIEGRSASDFESLIKKYELIPTEKQTKLLELVTKDLQKTLEKYGISNEVSTDHVHIVENEFFLEREGDEYPIMGKCYSESQHVCLNLEFLKTNSAFSFIAYHELLHLFSSSILIGKTTFNEDGIERFGLSPQRSGFSIPKKGNEEYILFHLLTEGVINKLAIDFLNRNDKNELFRAELALHKSTGSSTFPFPLKISYQDDMIMVESKPEMFKDVIKLDEIIERIFVSNTERFATKEEVFDFVAKILFTGKILEFAHLYEDSFGRGSFRKLAEETAVKEEDLISKGDNEKS